MTVEGFLRTKDLAEAMQISVQQVRNYEAAGFLPPVERSPNGYRRYTRQHLAALTTARRLIDGYGWEAAQQIMRALHGGRLDQTLALVDECHAGLAGMRGQLAQTEAALGLLAAQQPPATQEHSTERLRVGAAARLVGVRVSALRFWEQQGLLAPVRDKDSRYRLYDARQLRRLRIVVLLRQANHDFAAIRATLNELEAGQPERAVAAIEQRRRELAGVSWRCLQAGNALYEYVNEHIDSSTVRSSSTAAKSNPFQEQIRIIGGITPISVDQA
ncbi:MAG TPA: MerR family transcriptional regulator [Roseiflexaceae bacterium]|nr:MerR family transcriptional regulator [Roseiflexaceae bacterium]